MTDCPLCFIENRKDLILRMGMRVIVALSNPRLMPGHALIVPRRHVAELRELSAPEFEEVFSMATHYQHTITELFPGGGCDLSIHYRPFMKGTAAEAKGYAVPAHLHVHLRPRRWQDELWERSQRHEDELFRPLTPEEAKEMKAKFKPTRY